MISWHEESLMQSDANSHRFAVAALPSSIIMFIFQMRKQSPRNNWSQASQLLSHRAGTRTQVLDSLNLSLLNVSVVGFGGLCIFDFTSEQHATTVNLNQVVNRAYNLRKLDIDLPIPVVEQPVWVNCEFLLVLAGFFSYL